MPDNSLVVFGLARRDGFAAVSKVSEDGHMPTGGAYAAQALGLFYDGRPAAAVLVTSRIRHETELKPGPAGLRTLRYLVGLSDPSSEMNALHAAGTIEIDSAAVPAQRAEANADGIWVIRAETRGVIIEIVGWRLSVEVVQADGLLSVTTSDLLPSGADRSVWLSRHRSRWLGRTARKVARRSG
jgi:hypothetical protein